MLTRKFRETYIAKSDDFVAMCSTLLSKIPAGKLVASLVFYGNPQDNNEYSHQLNVLNELLCSVYQDSVPPFSYIAQKPLNGALILEVCLFEEMAGQEICYKQFSGYRYLTIRTGDCMELITAVSVAVDSGTTFQQATSVFQKINAILSRERMPVNSIVRQWNYIGDITGYSGGIQNYHQFNLARSLFYDLALWENGYPAATGIGITAGAVIVRIEAIVTSSSAIKNIAINNNLQVPAHNYSSEVLAGNDKTTGTPKFERARLLEDEETGTVFISGTAAIRGEKSMAEGDVAEQARLTIENILNLVPAGKAPVFEMFIIYLKYEQDFTIVKKLTDGILPETSPVYVLANLCRDELLVEMEGLYQWQISINS